MALIEDPVFPSIARLVTCLRDELAAAGGPGLTYAGLWVGSEPPPLGVSDGSSKDCGAAWVRVVAVYPSTVFPAADQDLTVRCGPLAYELEIGVARCAPRAEGRSLFPSDQAMFESLRQYTSDLRATRRALITRLPAANRAENDIDLALMLGEWTPLENAAGKSGGFWKAWIGAA